ncbi:MAG: hypothetical protein R2932_24300 [Caldilineaceae bacterium]
MNQQFNSKQEPVGWIHLFRPNIVSVITYIIVTGIIVVFVMRMMGSSPLSLSMIDGQNREITLLDNTERLILLASQQEKIFFFDPKSNYIKEVDLTVAGKPLKNIREIPVVRMVYSSPDFKKLLIIAFSQPSHNGMYILDTSSPISPTVTALEPWPGLLPRDFFLHQNSIAAWSPTGDQIAFIAYKASLSELFVADSNFTMVRRLTYYGHNVKSVFWIDSQTIAFSANWEREDAVYLIDSDGGNLRPAW